MFPQIWNKIVYRTSARKELMTGVKKFTKSLSKRSDTKLAILQARTLHKT